MKKRSSFQLVLTSIMLAIGIAVVWGFGLGGISSSLHSLFIGQSHNDFEDIAIDDNGRPLIHTRIGGSWQNQQYRTLDGKTVEASVGEFITAGLQPVYRDPGLVENPIVWRQRIAGIDVQGKPPVSWVLVRDDRLPGSAYFVGYEMYSNERIGFLSRDGLSASPPPQDVRFALGNQVFQWGSNLYASVGRFNIGSIGYNYGGNVSRPGLFRNSQVFLCDGNTVREVDLRVQKVRVVKKQEQLIGVAIVSVVSPEEADEDEKSRDQLVAEHRLLLRCSDRLILLNTFESTEVEFKLPPGLEEKSLTVSTSGPDRLLLQVNRGHWEQGSVVDLLTIKPEGEIEKQDTVRLLGYVPDRSPTNSLIPAGVVPSLLPWSLGMFFIAPLVMLQGHQASDYFQAIGKSWDEAWLGFLVVLAVSVILAFSVNHVQKKSSRSHTGLWTTFVFLLGVPGLVAYWLHFRGSPVAKCAGCGQEVPRDRDTCARCAEPFPVPALRGTEIFA